MGFFDSVKTAGKIAKLKGEILLVDREVDAEKKKLGIELFSLLWENDTADGDNKVPIQEGLAGMYEAARIDIDALVGKRQAKEDDLDKVHEGQGAMALVNASKLKTEIAYLDRETRLRKEIFGVQVYDELKLEAQATDDGDDSESGDEDSNKDKVLACIDKYVKTVRAILKRKRDKENEIAALSSS